MGGCCTPAGLLYNWRTRSCSSAFWRASPQRCGLNGVVGKATRALSSQNSSQLRARKEFSPSMSNSITKFTTAAIAALALSAGAFAQAPATAATNAAPAPTFGAGKIGVINIQAAIAATNEGRRDFDALQKKFE